MTPREKKLVTVLGVFGVFGIAFGFYYLLYVPYSENKVLLRKLQDEHATKSTQQIELLAKQRDLNKLKPRSLPGDPNVARREYEALLSSLILSSGVPSGYNITPKDPADANRVPLLGPKLPAYTRIGYEIVLRRVDLPTVVKFLKSYYEQPLLQQISRLTIKRTADSDAKRGDNRADLEVSISTEGVIIDGAEKRQTLYPISTAFGALGGGLGLSMLQLSAAETRAILPPAPSELADNRDYALLAAKDLFHGPLPEIKAEVIKTPKKEAPKVVVAAKPKEDISPYIRLTGITWRSDGTVVAEILDMANHHDYEVARVHTLDGLATRVKKFFYLSGERKPLESFDDLVIAEDGTSTDRKFKVLEFSGEGLVLSEPPLHLPVSVETTEPAAKGNNGKSSKGKAPVKKSAISVPQAPAALAGPLALVPPKPADKHYLWRIGTSLNELIEIPAAKVETESPQVAEEPREVTPLPRIEK